MWFINCSLILLLPCLVGLVSSTGSELYSLENFPYGVCYNWKVCGPKTWRYKCHLRFQSPIDLPGNISPYINDEFEIYEFPKFDHLLPEMTVQWKYVTFRADYRGERKVKFRWGRETFVLDSIHMHYGSNDGFGSEHTIWGKPYSGELHLVYYNMRYKNVLDAVAADSLSGVLVIAVLLDSVENTDVSSANLTEVTRTESINHNELIPESVNVTSSNNATTIAPDSNKKEVQPPVAADIYFLGKLLDVMQNARNNKSHTTTKLKNNGTADEKTDEIPLYQVFKGETGVYAYAYTGSLTSPPCSVALWLVLRTPVLVPKAHLKRMRKQFPVNMHVPNNFRPLQKLNGRGLAVVKINFLNPSKWLSSK